MAIDRATWITLPPQDDHIQLHSLCFGIVLFRCQECVRHAQVPKEDRTGSATQIRIYQVWYCSRRVYSDLRDRGSKYAHRGRAVPVCGLRRDVLFPPMGRGRHVRCERPTDLRRAFKTNDRFRNQKARRSFRLKSPCVEDS
jgi:hypothetical protein